MAVRFRYRSSVAFESLDLAGAAAISVGDFRSRILGPHLRRDFDLLISDAASNQTFDDDERLIPAGSDVVVKRVPMGSGGGASAPLGTVNGHNCGRGKGIVSLLPPSENVDLENFDDFGNELCPGLGPAVEESSADGINLDPTTNQKCSEMSSPRYRNIEGRYASQAMSEEFVGDNCSKQLGLEEENKEIRSNSKTGECQKMQDNIAKSSQVMPNMDLPTELRCFLCKTIFKDAVMIPCCQHSFCENCVRCALAEMKRCPKCSSTRCNIHDLLPNLSLRQAIEHFLEREQNIVGVDNLAPMYPPDGESGIQAKERSCALSICQQEQQLPCSSSATGKGSNQIMLDPAPETKRNPSIKIHLDGNKSAKGALGAKRNGSGEASKKAYFEGSASSAKLFPDLVEENVTLPPQEADARKIYTQDGSGFVMAPVRQRKGERTCYMCGSPNHLVRDCPVALNVHSGGESAFQGHTYRPSNWHGPMFYPHQPYGNIYGTPGIIPYDPGVVPVPPFGMPSYLPSFYGGMTTPYAFMRMCGMQSPVLAATQQPLAHTEFMDVHDKVKRRKVSSGKGVREYDFDNSSVDYHHDDDARRMSRKQHHAKGETSESYSDEGRRRVYRRHQKDKYCSCTDEMPGNSSEEEFQYSDQKHHHESYASGRGRSYHYSDKSSSELHNASDNSIRHGRQASKLFDRSASRRDKSRGKCESDFSSKSHCWRERAHDVDVATKHKLSYKHHNHLDHRLETDHSIDYRHDYKVKESSQSLRETKPKVSLSDGLWENDRWEMVDGSDDEDRGEYYHHRRKIIR